MGLLADYGKKRQERRLKRQEAEAKAIKSHRDGGCTQGTQPLDTVDLPRRPDSGEPRHYGG